VQGGLLMEEKYVAKGSSIEFVVVGRDVRWHGGSMLGSRAGYVVVGCDVGLVVHIGDTLLSPITTMQLLGSVLHLICRVAQQFLHTFNQKVQLFQNIDVNLFLFFF